MTLGTAVLFVEGTFFLLGCNDTRVPAVLALRRITSWRSRDGRLTMNILKIALLCSLRVAFFASLKVALLAYTVFLSDTALASNVSEGNGNVGDTISSAGPEVMH